jgi:hypothetical protein
MNGVGTSRRSLLRAVCRGAILGTLALVGVALAKRSVRAGETCTGNRYCRGCGRLGDCVLPQALSARQAGIHRSKEVIHEI